MSRHADRRPRSAWLTLWTIAYRARRALATLTTTGRPN